MSEPRRRVRREAGLLWPGFSKRLDEQAGTTYLWGLPIGRFDVCRTGPDEVELRYRRWPVVDVLSDDRLGAGHVRLPGGRRVRFCRFTLER